MRAIGDARSVLRRIAGAWLVALALLFGVSVAAAAPPLDPTGTPDVQYELPADQPRGTGRPIELPVAPPSFNTADGGEGGWIHFAYPPGARERVEPLLRDADAIRVELSARLGQAVLHDVHVRVARTPGEMTALAPAGAPYPRYASGVAYSDIGLVLLTLTPPQPNALHDVGEVFRHELAHVALEEAIGESHRVPHWFNEGLAVHLSRESSLLRLKTLSTATLAGRLIPLARLDGSFPSDAVVAELAYAEAADVVRFLLRREDLERFPALISRVREGQPFAAALRDAYGMDLSTLEHEWREDVAKRYSFWPVFFSGSIVWAFVLVLFAFGWRRRQQRSRETLERWAREEGYAELRRARAMVMQTPARVHIVLPGHESAAPEAAEVPELPMPPPAATDIDVPRVQHDGRWHTLH